mgnify:CR=1 FL=1
MRSILYTLLSLATLASSVAADTPSAKPTAKDNDWEEEVPDTIFNGEKVPPMIELTPETMDTEISKGNWYAYNPCPMILGNTKSSQDSRVLLALLRTLQAVQAHLPDHVRVLLHVDTLPIQRRACRRLAQLLHAIL